jgi:hypothetical protein
MDVAEVVTSILSHHGIKGMHWGVRSSNGKPSRADRKFEKKATSVDTWVKIHNGAADHFNTHIDSINKKYQKAIDRGDLHNSETPAYKNYHHEVSSLYLDGARKAAATHGMNPSGTKKLGIRSDEQHTFYVVTEDVKHADVFKVNLIYDDQGRVTGVSLDTTAQGALAVGDILEHHGVKGMHWGVRRKATVGPQEVIISDRRKKIKTSGGEGHPASEDAIRARTIGQRGKKSGLKSLSDAELKSYATRLQMEQNVKRLNYNEMNPGKKFVANLLGQTGKNTAQNVANEAGSVAAKRAIKLAAAAIA